MEALTEPRAALTERVGQEAGMTPGDSVAELVAAARAGREDAWNAIVERYLPLVTAVIARHRISGADADDVNQTVWLRLVENLASLREPAALPGWVATTTRNECLRVLRGAQRAVPVDPQGSSTLERPTTQREIEDDLLGELRLQALREALDDLPAGRRDVLLLLLTDPPVPYAEISVRLGIPVGSIGPTRARALEQLRRSPGLRTLTIDDGSGEGR